MAILRAQRGAPKSPSTNFNLYADLVTRHAPGDGSTYGGWTITIGIQGVNTGSTSSYSGYAGSHYGYYRQAASGNYSLATSYGDNPFIRSGYGNGAERWWRGNTIRINANADGYVRGTSSVVDLLQEIYSSDPDWLGTGSGPFQSFGSIDVGRVNQAPGAPTGLTVGARTDSTIALTWTAPTSNGGAAITSYIVEYAKNAAFTGALSATVTTLSATLTGLDLDTYYVRVRAQNSVGTGAASAVTQTATVTYPTAPPAPVAHTQTSNSMLLALTDPSYVGDGILERQLERALNVVGPWTNVPVTMPDTSVTGLTRATLYYFRFRVRNSVGWSPWTTAAAQTLAEEPSAPTGYFVTDIARTSARLSLGSVADNGGAPIAQLRYQLEHNSGLVEDRTVTSYVPVWMSLGTQTPVARRVRMMVANSGTGWQWSDWGDWVSFNANTSVPHAPVATFAATGDTTAVLDWDEPTGLGTVTVLGYRIRIGLDPELASPGVVEISKSSTARSHTFDGLQPGTTYYVQIYATSSAGPGSRTVPALFDTTSGVAPSAKSFWLRVGGVYRPGDIFIKVAGVWKKATPWQKIEGTWRKF